jgi:hypothetical protein
MKKRAILSLLTCVAITGLFSCTNVPAQPNADRIDQNRQEQLQQEATRQVGMPAIHNFTEKKQIADLYELRDNPNLVCYAYLYSEMTGKLIFFGKCIGYGIPYAAQFSNPQKQVYPGGYQESFGSLPQSEPNGLFMPNDAEGTWLIMIDPETNQRKPVYIEPRVIVSPFKLNI